jgi:death-on-curing protein
MIEPRFLSVDEILVLHRRLLARYGGQDGIRDRAMLLSAIGMPSASFGGAWLHPTLFEMAAAYAFHIAQNQPFLDGNKRAAHHAALVFLDRNGVGVRDPEHRLITAMLGLADRTVTKAALAELLAELAAK